MACSDFPDQHKACSDFRDQNLAVSDFRDDDDPSRLPRPKRRWCDKNIANHIWYAQTLATKIYHFQTFATEKFRRDVRDQVGYGANLWLRKRRDRRDQTFSDDSDRDGNGATFQTNMETARLYKSFSGPSRPSWLRRDSENGATQEVTARQAWPARTKIAVSRHSRPRWRWRDFPERGGDGAIIQNGAETATMKLFLATKVDIVRLSRPGWRRHDFSDQGEDGATFQTRTETARP